MIELTPGGMRASIAASKLAPLSFLYRETGPAISGSTVDQKKPATPLGDMAGLSPRSCFSKRQPGHQLRADVGSWRVRARRTKASRPHEGSKRKAPATGPGRGQEKKKGIRPAHSLWPLLKFWGPFSHRDSAQGASTRSREQTGTSEEETLGFPCEPKGLTPSRNTPLLFE